MGKACHLLCVEGEVVLHDKSQIPGPRSMAWPDGQELGRERTGRSETRRSGLEAYGWPYENVKIFVSHVNTHQKV